MRKTVEEILKKNFPVSEWYAHLYYCALTAMREYASQQWISIDQPPVNDREKEYILMDIYQQKDIAHYYDDTWFTESPLANGNKLLAYIPVPEFEKKQSYGNVCPPNHPDDTDVGL